MRRKKLNLFMALFGIFLIGFLAISGQARYIGNKFPPAFPPASDFVHSKDNPILSNSPGLTHLYKTETKDYKIINEITTTFNTLIIQGIRCRIVRDVEWTFVKKLNKKFLTRDTYNFYAWDNKGNIWDFGKDDFKYLYNDNWRLFRVSTKDSWLVGKNGKFPKIIIPAKANPK